MIIRPGILSIFVPDGLMAWSERTINFFDNDSNIESCQGSLLVVVLEETVVVVVCLERITRNPLKMTHRWRVHYSSFVGARGQHGQGPPYFRGIAFRYPDNSYTDTGFTNDEFTHPLYGARGKVIASAHHSAPSSHGRDLSPCLRPDAIYPGGRGGPVDTLDLGAKLGGPNPGFGQWRRLANPWLIRVLGQWQGLGLLSVLSHGSLRRVGEGTEHFWDAGFEYCLIFGQRYPYIVCLQRFMSFSFGMYRKSGEHVPGEALIGRSGRAMYAIDSMNCFCLLSTTPVMSS